jgi:hypoxanthine phosphoribosyltransferase
MRDEIDQVLISRTQIAERVAAVADRIVADLSTSAVTIPAIGNGVGELTLVPILTGSIIFVADLIRHLPLRMQLNMISVNSYPGTRTTTTGTPQIGELTNLPDSLVGRHVLVIDDILDSGKTMQLVIDQLRSRHPESLRSAVLLRKDRPQAAAVPIDYVCFDIPDEFVVGYGLDYNGYYRNHPEIVTLLPHIIEEDVT